MKTENTQNGHSKKWLWAGIAGVALACAIVVAIVLFGSNTKSEKELDDYDDEELLVDDEEDECDALPTADEIKRHFRENYSQELRNLETEVINRFGSEIGEVGFLNLPSEYSNCEVKLERITNITMTTAKARAKVRAYNENDSETDYYNFTLVAENGKWLIDDFDGYKDQLRQKLAQVKNGDLDSNDAFDEGEAMSRMAQRNIESAQWAEEERGTDVFAKIFTQRLSVADIAGWSKDRLCILRNTIYARHGYRFSRDDLFQHFSSFSWYTPRTSDAAAVYNSFSDIEKYNIDFIKRYE